MFLFAKVDDLKSKATISSGQITFTLEKQDAEITWSRLQDERYKEKELTKKWREEAVLYSQERTAKQKERRAAEKDQQQKYAVRQQMKVSSDFRY